MVVFKFKLYVDDESDFLKVVCDNDHKENKKSKDIKKLDSGFNSGKIIDIGINTLPIPQDWRETTFDTEWTLDDGCVDFGARLNEYDLQNHLKFTHLLTYFRSYLLIY